MIVTIHGVLILLNYIHMLGELALEALKITSVHSDVLSANIYNEGEIIELKMGSYLGVAAAATANPPHFIHLIYKPPGRPAAIKLGLVGKGITFDRWIIHLPKCLTFFCKC